MARNCYIGAPEIFILGQACYFVTRALGEVCYLVGSSLETRQYRDVDVRVIFDDVRYDELFGDMHQDSSAYWSLFCSGVSAWMRTMTGLPVDFQVQRRGSIREADWQKSRLPLGIYPKDSRGLAEARNANAGVGAGESGYNDREGGKANG